MEELLSERDVIVRYETIRMLVDSFGAGFGDWRRKCDASST